MRLRFTTFALVAAALVAACGNLPGSTQAATAASVAIQSGDIPKGMVKCAGSGDVDSYLKSIQSSDPSNYQTSSDQWTQAKKDGAVKGQVVLAAESTAACTDIEKGNSGTSSAKELGSFVIQFDNATDAAKAYTGDTPILGIKPSELKLNGESGVVEGTKTGLGSNSIVFSASVGGASAGTIVVAARSSGSRLGRVYSSVPPFKPGGRRPVP